MNTIPSVTVFGTALMMTGLSVGSGSTVSARSYGTISQQSDNSPVVLIVNKDQFSGNWKQFKGDLKKQWGKLTDDDLLVIEGNFDKFEGRLQERYGDRKEEVKQWTDDWFKKHHPLPAERTDK